MTMSHNEAFLARGAPPFLLVFLLESFCRCDCLLLKRRMFVVNTTSGQRIAGVGNPVGKVHLH